MNLKCTFIPILLTLSICATGQSKFAFDQATTNQDIPKAQYASAKEEIKSPVLKVLTNTGPYHVQHDRRNNSLNIKMDNVFDVVNYTLEDLNGEEIQLSAQLVDQKIKVHLDHLPRGLYVLKLHSSFETFTTKIQHGI